MQHETLPLSVTIRIDKGVAPLVKALQHFLVLQTTSSCQETSAGYAEVCFFLPGMRYLSALKYVKTLNDELMHDDEIYGWCVITMELWNNTQYSCSPEFRLKTLPEGVKIVAAALMKIAKQRAKAKNEGYHESRVSYRCP